MKQNSNSNKLTTLPNIGKTIADRLMLVGIEIPDDLKSIGSENAFIRIKTLDQDACIHELMALEGAIQGIRWHNLDSDRKVQLKYFFEMCKLKK